MGAPAMIEEALQQGTPASPGPGTAPRAPATPRPGTAPQPPAAPKPGGAPASPGAGPQAPAAPPGASPHAPATPSATPAPSLQPPASPGGPLLAVCGLCGGAGASTLSYLVALAAARSTDQPVLVCDTGGPTGGLAAYARVRSPRSLPRVADALAAHEPLAEGLFADGGQGLRVIASAPELDAEGDEDGAARLLGDARAAHSLTVVDCGTAHGGIDRVALAAATHVAWVLPATPSGVHRGGRVLELFAFDSERQELVVARRDASERKSSGDDLKALAESRNAPLVLMPHVPDLGEKRPNEALETATLTLDSIVRSISR